MSERGDRPPQKRTFFG